MKNLTVLVSLFLCIALTNNSLAMGCPHNLLAGKKSVKKEKVSNNNVQNISKKVIMSNENRFIYVGQKVLSILFKHSI
jgi:TRAP-type mannitol/chloroaromatic compound transport system permease large subunit